MTLTTYKDYQELFRNAMLHWTGKIETSMGFLILPSGITITPKGVWSSPLDLGIGKTVLLFNGTSNYIQLGAVSTFNFLHKVGTTGKWTIAFYYKQNNYSAHMSIISTVGATSSSSGCEVLLTGTNRQVYVRILRGVGGTTLLEWVSPVNSVPSDLNWHHCVVTYDKTLASAQCKAYIDGVFVGSGTDTGLSASTSDATNVMRIGYSYQGDGPYQLNGYLSDLIIFNGLILPQPEIVMLSRLSSPTIGKSQLSPIMPGVRGVE